MNLFYIDSTVRRSREFSVSNFSMTRLARTRKIEESILSLIWTTSTKILSHPLSGIESWRSNPTSILLSIYSTPISNSLPDEETWKLCWVVHSGTNFEQESQDTFILILSALTIVIFSSRIFFILIQKRRFMLLSTISKNNFQNWNNFTKFFEQTIDLAVHLQRCKRWTFLALRMQKIRWIPTSKFVFRERKAQVFILISLIPTLALSCPLRKPNLLHLP